MKLAPLGDKVVLKQVEAQETTKSGIVLKSRRKQSLLLSAQAAWLAIPRLRW